MKRIPVPVMAAILSVLNSLLFHFPFFNYAFGSVEKGLNGILIIAGLMVIMLTCNYFAFYLILFLGRAFGKFLMSFIFVGNSVGLYFINTYDVMIDDTMMGNVFNTNFSEATSYWSPAALAYILLMGVLPCILIWMVRLRYGTWKMFFKNIGYSLLVVAVVAFANMSNWMWVDKNSTVGGSLLLPWSYIVNTFRFRAEERERNREEIKLPDATVMDNEKSAVVLVIGESARRDHFSLYGYERNTNPFLSSLDNVTAYKADASATYTTGGVKAILEHEPTGKLYEILPNYLYRTGVDVCWRSTNWGQPPLHIEKYQNAEDISNLYGCPDEGYDGLLLEGLPEIISESGSSKVLVILHTSTSHGPSYNKKYPPEFETFTPVCTTVEMSKCPREEVINAYDNTIIYTDYLLNEIAGRLNALKDWRSCMIYVSDHGESLGENNLYMHGVPLSIAPAEQVEIPFIVWTSDAEQGLKHFDKVSQHHVFHSVLHFLGVESPVYKEEFNVFE